MNKNYISFTCDKNDFELINIADGINFDRRTMGLSMPPRPFAIKFKNIMPDDYEMSLHFVFYYLINKNDERIIKVSAKGKQVAQLVIYNGNKNSYHSFRISKNDFDTDGHLSLSFETHQIRSSLNPVIAGISWKKSVMNEENDSSIPVCIQGFTKSGSGAVWDLLSEYDNIDVERSAELRIPLCINRAKDYVQEPNRIRQLMTEVYKYYERDCHGEEVSAIYNDDFLFAMNHFFADVLDCSELFKEQLNNRNFRFPMNYTEQWKDSPFVVEESGLKKIKYVVTPEKQQQFLEIAGKYLSPFLHTFKGKKYKVFFNWAVRCSAQEARKMSGNAKFVAVWRDPRDQYACEAFKHKESRNSYFINVDTFINWYKNEIASWINTTDENILPLRFEDVVNNYENTINTVNQFLQTKSEHHVYKRMFLIPEESQKTIGIYKEYENHPDIIKISEELKEYLYHPNGVNVSDMKNVGGGITY